MEANVNVLLFCREGTECESLRQALAANAAFKVQPVRRLSTALARMAGSGINAVVVDVSLGAASESEVLDNFLQLRGGAGQAALVAVCDSEEDTLLMRAVRAGAAHYCMRERAGDLPRLIASAIEKRSQARDVAGDVNLAPQPPGAVIAFLGAKGGVGTTTVALNVAAALAATHDVALAELHARWGTLAALLHPRRMRRDLLDLLQRDPDVLKAADVEDCLWRCHDISRLRVLFSSERAEYWQALGAAHAKAIVSALAAAAERVVVDLPALCDASRAVLEISSTLGLVLERDPVCVQSAKTILQAIEAWNDMPRSIGAVIVNRAPLALPMPIHDIEMQLGIPAFGVIPPAPDLCIAAEEAHRPIISWDPDSLAAGSLAALAGMLEAPVPCEVLR